MWGFLGLPLDGSEDCRYPLWLVATGWSMYLLALVVAELIIAFVLYKQTEYGLVKKIYSAVRPSRNWGPNDHQLQQLWKMAIDRRTSLTIPACSKTVASANLNDSTNEPNIFAQNQGALERVGISLVRLPNQRDYTGL